jgi:hypothetical protein
MKKFNIFIFLYLILNLNHANDTNENKYHNYFTESHLGEIIRLRGNLIKQGDMKNDEDGIFLRASEVNGEKLRANKVIRLNLNEHYNLILANPNIKKITKDQINDQITVVGFLSGSYVGVSRDALVYLNIEADKLSPVVRPEKFHFVPHFQVLTLE